MQPNLPQDAKFNPRNRDAIMRRYLAISRYAGQTGGTLEQATHLIWPESAFPFLLHRDAGALAQIAAILRPGTLLITGAARMDEPLPGESVGKFYNAIQTIDDRGTILDILRQGPSGAVRRIPAEVSRPGHPRRRLAAIHQHPGRISSPAKSARPCRCRACRRWPRPSATRRSFRMIFCRTARGRISS